MQPREKQRENDSRHRSPFPSSSPSRPHLSAGGGGIFPTGCFQLVPRLFRPFSSLCPPPIRAMPRNAFYSLRGSARVSRRRLHGCIYITCSSVDISLFFFLFRFFFGMVSFGIWEGWFHRDARRLIELLPLSRTFSMDVARCVRWPTIGSRDLVQNFSLSFLLFFL